MSLTPTASGLVFHEDAAHRPARQAWRALATATDISPSAPIPWQVLVDWVAEARSSEDGRTLLGLCESELGLPKTCKAIIGLRNRGDLTDAHFRVETSLRHPFVGSLRRCGTGPWLRDDAGFPWLLDANAWRLVDALDPPPPPKGNERHLWWARVRRLAEAAEADLHPYLADEDAVELDQLRPVFREEGDAVVVDFETDGVCQADLDAMRQVAQGQFLQRDVHTLGRREGKRRRVIVTDRGKQALTHTTRHQRTFRGKEAAAVLEHPEAFFPEDLFDLSHYSERVIAVGPPRYRANVAMTRPSEDRGWQGGEVDALILELYDDARPESPPVQLDMSEREARVEAHHAITTALDQGQAFAEVQGRLIRADPQLAMALGTTFEARPDDELVTRPAGAEKSVLHIKDNLDHLDHTESDGLLPRVPSDWRPSRPALLSRDVTLRPHQEEGFAKLSWWEHTRSAPIRGGLIADDMGLGKTLQALSLMATLAERGELRPSLVIAPTALLDNWRQEAARFVPAAIKKVAFLRDVPRGREPNLKDYDLVLTSYEMLARRDLEMGRIEWKVIVCDEAQKIKNPSTRMSHAAKAMKARFRLAVTGTPVENSLDELWSIADFFQPGMLGALKDFRDRYSAPAILDDDEAREAAADDLIGRLEPVLLRRMKADVAKDLPQLHRHVVPVPLADKQLFLYRVVQRELRNLSKHDGRGAALAAISKLLQLCAHPFLLNQYETHHRDPITSSPKLERTLHILDEVRSKGEKALVFARWVDLQHLLKQVLDDRYQLNVHVLNGTTPSAQRQRIVDDFSRRPGFDVLVLSARACGVGLNITAANHVIHYTREWNPAVEAQATDRTYRIGQQRDVHVWLPIVTSPEFNTVEQTLDTLLSRKETLRSDFVRPSGKLDISLDDFRDDLSTPTEASQTTLGALIDDLKPEVIAEHVARHRSTELIDVHRVAYGATARLADGRHLAIIQDPKAFLASPPAGPTAMWIGAVVPQVGGWMDLSGTKKKLARAVGEVVFREGLEGMLV